MTDDTADNKLYERLDTIADLLLEVGEGTDPDGLAEALMPIMGLMQIEGVPALNPDLRDRSTRVVRRWLTDRGYLPRGGKLPFASGPPGVVG